MRSLRFATVLVGAACSGRGGAPAEPAPARRLPVTAPAAVDAAPASAWLDAASASAGSPRLVGCTTGACEVANLSLSVDGLEVVAADAQAVTGQAWSTTISLRNPGPRPRVVRFAVDGAPWIEPADGSDLPGRTGCGIARGHGYGVDPQRVVPAGGVLDVAAPAVARYQDCAGAERALPIGRYRVAWSTTLGTLHSQLDVLDR